MTKDEAWYILRAEIAMAEEGVGVSTYEPGSTDAAIVSEAFRIAGDQVPEYSLWAFKDEHREQPIKRD